ncbi:hypothetical protein LUZ60_000139 [Juncus effusus]|nr:hypothetical protein LUZ60_000139 [Juncus effusus]
MAEELKKQRPPHILLIPFPAQGHILPFLDFAHLLSLRNFSLTILTTPSDLHILTPLLSKSPSIQTLTLPFPSHPSVPCGVTNTKGQHPTFFFTLIGVLAELKDPILSWIQSQTDNPISAIISDFFVGWAQPLAEQLGIPRVVFSPSGVLATAVMHSLFRRIPKRPDSDSTNDEYSISFPDIPNCPSYKWRKLSMLYRTYVEGDPVSEAVKQNFLWNLESSCFISNTFVDLECAYFGRPLKDLGLKRVWAVGPLAPSDGTIERGGVGSVSFTEISAWLDSRQKGSVLYVSFGSIATLTATQAALIASALERSGVSFIWVMSEDTIPDGFTEKNSHNGMVIRGWAPQVAILRHQSVGYFLTHCGWNSVLEAVAAGVAMLAWPMTADQFINARLVVEEAGVAVRAWEGGFGTAPEEAELVKLIEEMIGEKGKGVRKRVEEMKEIAAEAVREGGSSFVELEGLVEELWKIKKN